MNSNNKILTVSYGTFSCTLEGFDDSFHTMKAIAEYFRDLASDDRYFGAEPPQPDAEMLARIAEREIARRVEARMNEGRIFLSATAPEAAPAEQAAPAAAAPVAPAAPKETEATPDVAPDMVPETDEVQLQDDNTVADAQQGDDIDDAFDHAKAGDMLHTAPDAQAVEEPLEDSAAEAFFADATEDTAEADAGEDEQAAMAVAETVDSTPRDRVIPHADSIAAKLERIRAVVSQADDEDLDDDYSEDEHAEELLSDAIHADENFEDDAFEDEDAQTAEDDALMNAMMAQDEDDAQDAARESTASEVIAEAAAEASAALDEDDTMTVAEDEDDGDVAAILARLDGESPEEDAEDQVMSGDDTDADDMNLFDDSDDGDDDDEEIMIVEDEDSAEDAAAPAPRITRIVKVKRADLEAAIAQGNLEEMADDEDDLSAPAATAKTSSLSEEDEDALLRELADVEAGLIEDEADEDEAARAAHVARAAAAKLEDAADDSDVARLMAKTDAEMGEPESARRRDAFAHLRAAVAAKNSDDGIVGDKLAEDALEVRAYQTDLADVVKPRRPELRGAGRDRRPDTQRPAPLKLVAEQRVDAVQPAALTTPVRPRRVEQPVAVVDTSSTTNSFAEFAEDMGAHELPDLLEAAAAYLAFVEERDQFSRPQLMTKVRQVIGTDFSREDGLRSFGQLLRAGKIEKIKGGRFAVSGDIGFRPDQRAAG